MSPGIATSINIHVPFTLSRITMSGLLLGMVRQFVLFGSTVWLPYLLDLFLLILVHVHTSVLRLIVLLLLLLLMPSTITAEHFPLTTPHLYCRIT
jgi:hypothetical protein